MSSSSRRDAGRGALELAWRTDTGRVRQRNEDAVAVLPEIGLVVVADGVGGASAGDVASRLAAEIICERLEGAPIPPGDSDTARRLTESAIAEANQAVWELAQSDASCAGMGTTVVVGRAGADWLAFANVGDSRLYRLREGALEQLSRDHSFIQDVVDQGFFRTREDARRYGIGENILTRALGSAPTVEIDSGAVKLEPGDLFLFCTDGLSGMVSEDWLRQLLVAAADRPLELASDALVKLANDCGGSDNITLALVRVGGGPKA